ncbi:FecR family protein [Peristeroidobacter soli]|jgi:transmembrane sensor|uniref:FecR family protein n=1 Tax=Peristeroidobacter soli TaxID=2497877 RepID=UPI00158F0657|nr:FecR domain-containing protein [Peristeroidobacter soli]
MKTEPDRIVVENDAMSELEFMERDDPIEEGPEEQAAAWLMRLTSGEAAPELVASFERWRDENEDNARALAQARTFWLQLERPLQDRYAPRLASQRCNHSLRRKQRRQVRVKLLAAAILAFCMLGVGREWWHNWRFDQVSATGAQRTLALADGSTMWLNTDSAANVEMTARERHVKLARGEAFFDVKRDEARPFIIDAGMGKVRVLGTAFAVRNDGAGVLVTVARGKVKVSGEAGSSVDITKDQRVRVSPDGSVGNIQMVNAEHATAWRTGYLVFENATLAEILAEIERYDARIIVANDARLSEVRVNAIVDVARIDEWFDNVERKFPLKIGRFGPLVWISDAPAHAS